MAFVPDDAQELAQVSKTKETKQRGSKVMFWIIVLLVVAGGAAYWYFFR